MAAPYRSGPGPLGGGHRPAGSGSPVAPCIMGVLGFNPFRAQRRSAADYVIVAAAFAVIVALVLWAAL